PSKFTALLSSTTYFKFDWHRTRSESIKAKIIARSNVLCEYLLYTLNSIARAKWGNNFPRAAAVPFLQSASGRISIAVPRTPPRLRRPVVDRQKTYSRSLAAARAASLIAIRREDDEA